MELSQFKTVEQLAAAIKTMDMVTSIPWTDYSGTSTIVGWTSYTQKIIEYKKIGKLVFVNFWLAGESDNVATTFTVPFNEGHSQNPVNTCLTEDDGTRAIGFVTVNTALAAIYPTAATGAWTNTGDKEIYGQFWYEAA